MESSSIDLLGAGVVHEWIVGTVEVLLTLSSL